MRRNLIDDVAQGKNLNLTTRQDIVELWPEFEALRTTVQDKDWHAEGDVLIHTEMVLNECTPLVADKKHILYLSALFHDIAKSKVTRYEPEIDHIIAPQHERIGGVQARYLLREKTNLNDADRLDICDLVSTHHLVKRTVKKMEAGDSDLVPYLESLSARVNTKYLWLLELADMKGRVCIDQERQLEIVELFKMLCEDLNVFGKAPDPWATLSNCSEINFCDDFVAEYVLAEAHRKRLIGDLNEYSTKAFCYDRASKIGRKEIPYPAHIIVPIGISGSGKSTSTRTLYPNHLQISPDAERKNLFGDESVQGDSGPIHQICHEKLREVLRSGGKAIYDATNIVPDLRSKITTLCHDYGALVTFLIFDTSIEEAKLRNKSRERQVPEEVIERQAFKFEWPLPEEYHRKIVI